MLSLRLTYDSRPLFFGSTLLMFNETIPGVTPASTTKPAVSFILHVGCSGIVFEQLLGVPESVPGLML